MAPSISPSTFHDCFLCSAHHLNAADLPWYDRPLLRRDGVGTAVGAVGAFVPGYVLVSPMRHESSVRGLERSAASAFLDFLTKVQHAVERRFGPATLFEHGSCRSEERRRSACVTHSHVHVVPGQYSLDRLGLPARRFDTLGDMVALPRAERALGYLMYREPGGVVCCAPDAGVSQFFRRHIAATLGCPDEWDYAVFPRWDNLRATQDAFRTSGDGFAHDMNGMLAA